MNTRIREAIPEDREKILRLLHDNIGHGPYIDSCAYKAGQNNVYSFVYEENSKIVSFVMIIDSLDITRKDSHYHSEVTRLLEGKRVFTGYILVVDSSCSNRNIGHEMALYIMDFAKSKKTEYFYYEFIIPQKIDKDFKNGKIHWVVRDLYKNKSVYYKYSPGYFSFTTSSDDDYCTNCGGKCGCGAVIFIGKL